jgi:hypothetical protein
MRGKIGCPAKIITPVPHIRELAKGETKELSEKAKFRLKVFDWYYHKSALYSLSGLADASLTCRHFGIQRSYFYPWKARYDKRRFHLWKTKQPAPKYAQSRFLSGVCWKSKADGKFLLWQ